MSWSRDLYSYSKRLIFNQNRECICGTFLQFISSFLPIFSFYCHKAATIRPPPKKKYWAVLKNSNSELKCKFSMIGMWDSNWFFKKKKKKEKKRKRKRKNIDLELNIVNLSIRLRSFILLRNSQSYLRTKEVREKKSFLRK